MLLEVFPNTCHSAGPIPALLRALQTCSEKRCLLVLSDIFFQSNPYIAIKKMAIKHQNILCLSSRRSGRNALAIVRGSRVTRLYYGRGPAESSQRNVLSWNGIALFRPEILGGVSVRSESVAKRRLEDLFNSAVSEGHLFQYSCGSDFVNVNSLTDLTKTAKANRSARCS
jgi:hypothetical protein